MQECTLKDPNNVHVREITFLSLSVLLSGLGFLHRKEHSFPIECHHTSIRQWDDGQIPEGLQDVFLPVAVLQSPEVANQQLGQLTQAAIWKTAGGTQTWTLPFHRN